MKYATVYRDNETQKLVRITNLSFEDAVQKATKNHGDVHAMNGVASRRIYTLQDLKNNGLVTKIKTN